VKISIGTLFPDLYVPFFASSLFKRAFDKGFYSYALVNLFSFVPKKKRIDSPLAGGGAGMIIEAPVIERACEHMFAQCQSKPYTIFFSPHGKRLTQDRIKTLAPIIAERGLCLIAGRYEGIDARAEEQYADEIVSIGDYVLCGGDLPAMVFLEALMRMYEGFVGNYTSVTNDSFYGTFLDAPQFAQPDVWQGKKIPEVLKSGDHQRVFAWKKKESVKRSISQSWQWTREHLEGKDDKALVREAIPSHYCVLMHNDVVLPLEKKGNSTVTSIDIHDIARSAKTYGLEKYFIVTRLAAQRSIVAHFLEFWEKQEVKEFGSVASCRKEALKEIILHEELSDVITDIEKREGVRPLVIATSGREASDKDKVITFHSQEDVWRLQRPILFLFGTAHGLSSLVFEKCDFRLIPVEGLSEFNFLSVRSAVAVILDRWFGCNKR
jgi:tRNA (guanine37-N1)-methyltransferase